LAINRVSTQRVLPPSAAAGSEDRKSRHGAKTSGSHVRYGLVSSSIITRMKKLSWIAGLCLVPATLVMAQDVGRGQPRQSKDTMKDTRIQESAFRLTLPGKWVQKPSSDPTRWVYQNEDGREQLTVSLPLGSIRRLSKEEQSKTLRRLAELSRRAVTQVTDVPADALSETTFGEADGVLAARFGGVQSARQYRFTSLLLCSPSAVTTFYYETTGLTEAEFNTRGRTMMNSIVVPR